MVFGVSLCVCVVCSMPVPPMPDHLRGRWMDLLPTVESPMFTVHEVSVESAHPDGNPVRTRPRVLGVLLSVRLELLRFACVCVCV
jgi:hypothetical protein